MKYHVYVEIRVFRRLADDELILYRCLQQLPDGGYSIQSADRIRLPLQADELRQHEAQFLELLSEEVPRTRNGLFATIEQAIDDFDSSFAIGS